VSTVKKTAKKAVKKAAAKSAKKSVAKKVSAKAAVKSAAPAKKAAVRKTAATRKNAAPKKKESNPVVLLGRECLKLISEKKGEDAVFLDLREVNSYLDYFIICTASSKIHCRALAKDIEEFYAAKGQKPRMRPDYDSEWVILDYYGLVIHIFTEQMRSYYDLDKLWADAERL
jgi:ribosome-associated protein